METRKILTILVVALALMAASAEVSGAEPMGTAFTYQGRLIEAGSPAQGEYDFQFELYDEPVDGNQLDGTIEVNELNVSDGYFTVVLDFGAGVFDGDARWLDIGVRQGALEDPNTYADLDPRQEVTPTPYALYAETAGGDTDWMVDGNDMYAIPSGNVGIGTTTPSEKLEVNGNININSVFKIGGDTVLAVDGTENIFVGVGAGENNTTGYQNSAVGRDALYSNTQGYANSAVGRNALFCNTTGSHNSAIGGSTLYDNTTGSHNSAIGTGALNSNTTGYSNSAMGEQALEYNTTGSYNTGLGYGANKYNQEGSTNTIIGYEAGRGTVVHNKSGNVFLGYKAGYNETGSNKLYIANDSDDSSVLIYGDFSLGNVGIGTTSPAATLDVNGPIKITDGSQGADKVLTSDASGLASWQTPTAGSGTYYWSCVGANFLPRYNDTSNTDIDRDSASIEAEENGVHFFAPVMLPHGANVTKVVVYGNVPAEDWSFRRITLNSMSMSVVTNANIGTEVTLSHTINNNAYAYVLWTSSLDIGGRIYNARITYTN